MALVPTGGFLMDGDTGALALTTTMTGATFSGGFLRSPTGQIVVVMA